MVTSPHICYFFSHVFNLSNISKRYGQHIIFEGASLQVNPGEKIGLVGPNGAGKTTIFRIVTHEEGIDSGSIGMPDKTVVGYFSQSTGEMSGRSAVEEVKAGLGKLSQLAAEISRMEKLLESSATTPMSDDDMATLVDQYSEAQAEFEHRGGYDLESRCRSILSGLGIEPDDQDRQVEQFSGGWKMRIALAKILALNPDLLLMDEPTNHLDLESIEWLESWLANFKGSLVMTSHDREFLNRSVTRIIEVAHKKITSYSGNYDFYDREREVRMTQLLASHKKQQAMLAKEEEFIARFAARASHAAQVQSRVKKLDKIERVEIPAEERVMEFEFAEPPRSGNDVVVMKGLAKVWTREDGKEKPVFSGVTGVVSRLNRVAVVGINGAGKSTLLKVIIGQADPTSGMVNLGANVKVGYFSQHSLEVLNPDATLVDEVSSRVPNANLGFVRNLLGAFLFSGDDVYKKIRVLSGGEKSRVVLATILANPVNLLVLDEPTNHLDIKSREMLLSALQKFDGTILIVSHDRHFLKSVSNRVFEVDHGALNIYEGNYDYYLSKKKHA
jgi:ATP-binding cassette subfamily F protein 3